ncbi:MAG: hypothetical protein OXH68_15825 [Gammaproteobacteria bacterium]|nr:hypothetical protein [Gammaproteobacteria bacterium]
MVSSTNAVAMMYPTVIDTLRLSDRLKAAGFDDPQAEGMARALGDELADNIVTKRDLDGAVQSLRLAIEAMDTKFEARFEGLEPRFDSIDAKFEALEPRFDSIDTKFEALEPRFDAIDAKLESQHRELSSRFSVLFATMALGFTLVIGLIGYSLFSPRPAEAASAVERDTAEVRFQ